MDVFERKIRIPVRRNDKLLKGNFKVVNVDSNGTRVEMKTKRSSNSMTVADVNDVLDPLEEDEFGFRPDFQEVCSQYRHSSEDFVGAITQCNDDGEEGEDDDDDDDDDDGDGDMMMIMVVMMMMVMV